LTWLTDKERFSPEWIAAVNKTLEQAEALARHARATQ